MVCCIYVKSGIKMEELITEKIFVFITERTCAASPDWQLKSIEIAAITDV